MSPSQAPIVCGFDFSRMMTFSLPACDSCRDLGRITAVASGPPSTKKRCGRVYQLHLQVVTQRTAERVWGGDGQCAGKPLGRCDVVSRLETGDSIAVGPLALEYSQEGGLQCRTSVQLLSEVRFIFDGPEVFSCIPCLSGLASLQRISNSATMRTAAIPLIFGAPRWLRFASACARASTMMRAKWERHVSCD